MRRNLHAATCSRLLAKQAVPRCSMESRTEVNRQCNRHTLTPQNSSSFPSVRTVLAPRSGLVITATGIQRKTKKYGLPIVQRMTTSSPPTAQRPPTTSTQRPVSALRVAFDIYKIGTILGSRTFISLRQKVQGPSVEA